MLIIRHHGGETTKMNQVMVLPEQQIKQKNRTYTDDQIVSMFLKMTCMESEFTLRNYSRAIQLFRQFLSFKPLREVTWKEVEVFKISLSEGLCSPSKKPLSPASVANFLAPIRSLYKWGSDPNIGLFTVNPTTCIRSPKVPVTSKNHYLTKKEAIHLLIELKKIR